MTREWRNEFMESLKNTTGIILHNAVVFYYSPISRMTCQRNMLSTDKMEVDKWLQEVEITYKQDNITFISYIDGEYNDSFGTTFDLFDDLGK